MIAYIDIGGAWSVARLDDACDGFQWWTDRDGWVSPHSSHWAMTTCWNRTWENLRDARAFARNQGWGSA